MEARIHKVLKSRGGYRAVIMEELDHDGNHVRFFSAVLNADGDYVKVFPGPESSHAALAYLKGMDLDDEDDQDNEPPSPQYGGPSP